MGATKRIAVLVSLLLVSTLAITYARSYARQRRDRVHLMETGEFHGDEITAKTGQRWLGLFVNGSGAVLWYSKIQVRTVFDDVADYGTRKKTGKKVSVQSPGPVFLLSRATMLKPGPVISLFKGKPDFNKGLEKFPIQLKLGRKSYVLKVISPDKNPSACAENAFPKNARLVLITRKSVQTLYTLDNCGNEPYWYLLWAGDLDRDGKLDVYVNVTQHYDISERRLFLSSHAAKGKLVKEVASFITGGC